MTGPESDDRVSGGALDDAALAELHRRAVADVCAAGPFATTLEPVLGVPMEVFSERHRSLRQLFDAVVDRQGPLGAVTIDGATSTRDELRRSVDLVAAGLAARHGIGPGDRVAILAANCREWIEAFWAVTSLGGVVCACNGWWTTDEIDRALADLEPRLLIGDARRLERVGAPPPGCTVCEIESDWASLRHSGERAGGPPTPVAVDEDDPALVLFTSGTTGAPRGAVISHRGLVGFVQVNLCNGAVRARRAVLEAEARGVDPATVPAPAPPAPHVTLVTSPMFHVSGLFGAVLMGFATGARLVLRRGRFDPLDVLALIEREGVTNWSPIGSTGPRVIHHPDFARFDVSTVRQIGFGGGPTSPARRAEVQAAFPNVEQNLATGYGSTETVASVVSNAGADYERHPSSVGRPNPTCRVEIWDADDAPLPDGELGRIVVQSPYGILGYWRDADATAAVVRRDRFVDTGDFGRIVDGMVTLDARARDLIIRSGENVSPIEVEACLDAHPAVAECAVIGVDHPLHGQEVAAVVVPVRGGVALDTGDLAAHCAATLAPYKVPTVWVVRREPLPRNAAGKVLKRELSA